MKKYIKIENDPCFICERLREIDKSYFVVFNKDTQHFEVHSSEQIGGSYCFTVRFDELDERTIDYALKSRKERQSELIEMLDRENEKLRNDNINKVVETLVEVMK